MLKLLIQENYNIGVNNITLLTDHIQSKVYLVESEERKYIFKLVPTYINNPQNEGEIADYLANNGICVPRLIKTETRGYILSDGQNRYHLQEFVEGEIFKLHTAPDWFLVESAQMLGKIQNALRDYNKLPESFGESFFSKISIDSARESYLETIKQANANNDFQIVMDLERRLKHLEEVATFSFDYEKLTKCNSHGDYWIGQIIADKQKLTVVDWTSACFLPACWEVIMSFTYAEPTCKQGEINTCKFKQYLAQYLKYFPLNDYDLTVMPYLYYYQLAVCNYYQPYYGLPAEYLEIAKLATNLMEWLQHHADSFSESLRAL